ncbi:malonic semialdehyde reductase [Cupriavidus respiraculi]|uniref:Putative NADH dehydrogenase/NAD(P)H nitroreductase LMG21510_02205 n=1 Tax=Cupriavidus respiraculi TaxID=195930 RepID=A0ABM8X069_9BURK|nr:malonic semialdehyde reductase [Cupriavidus respiraculi]MBY4945543.1 malonic semialdehyde reductase [Cupriavidus respiraculi]CAG9173267.1 putative malonic semialdehyde reductase RutE [Cupriavidus respiraculi]
MTQIAPAALAQLFTEARTHSVWQDRKVDDALLHQLYEAMKFGPTAANSSPARIVFVKSAAEKARLVECVAPGNVDKTRSAPITAIIAFDNAFHEQLPKLFPHADARSWYAGNAEKIARDALVNSSLQGGYFILAARALGLDCGPMGGFDAAKVNAAFFPDGKWSVNFLCNLGYGEADKLHPRGPRLSFDEACRIV